MSCNNPLYALDLGYDEETGKKKIKILPKRVDDNYQTLKDHYGEMLMLLPCGHCFGCCQDYSRMWQSRIMLEASRYEKNCFITLTFDDAHLPEKLEKRPLQLFLKRLRKRFSESNIRFFACGEVGDQTARPHYHAILFNCDFDDKKFLKRSKSGLIIYRSETLEQLWPFGISSIGEVSSQSASYVAKYSVKRKISKVDNGEFVLMSRRPGIGALSYSEDIYESDRVYVSGRNYKVPRYFDKLAEKDGSIIEMYVKEMRVRNAKKRPEIMYNYGLPSQEEAFNKRENDAIFEDACKVRL